MTTDKGFKIVMFIYLIMFIADLVSTIINGELVKHLEVNPLFKYGGLPLIFFINLVIIFLYYYWYDKSKNPFTRFTIIYVLITIIITRIWIVYNNIQTYQQYVVDPIATVEAAKLVTTQMKQAYMIKYVAMPNLLPIFNSLLAFMFFKVDHIINRRKDGQRKTDTLRD